MRLAEVIKDSREAAVSFLEGVAFCDDTSHDAVGVRRDEDSGDKWLAVVINYDAQPENDLDRELDDTDEDAIKLYMDKYPQTERYDSTDWLIIK